MRRPILKRKRQQPAEKPTSKKQARKGNILWQAANMKQRTKAIALIQGALGLQPDEDMTNRHVTAQYRWEQFPPYARLMEIETWLKAESRALMDLREGPEPKDIVGTND